MLISCSKNAKENLAVPRSSGPDKVINAKVVPGEAYVLNIANSGGVRIYQQALHYSLSQAGANEDGSLIYQYISAKGFTGTDKVMLLHTVESALLSNSNDCNYVNSGMSSRVTLIELNLAVQ